MLLKDSISSIKREKIQWKKVFGFWCSNLPAGHQIPLQVESAIIASVDVLHQSIHFVIVSLWGQFHCLFKCITSSQKAAQPKERATAKTVNINQYPAAFLSDLGILTLSKLLVIPLNSINHMNKEYMKILPPPPPTSPPTSPQNH